MTPAGDLTDESDAVVSCRRRETCRLDVVAEAYRMTSGRLGDAPLYLDESNVVVVAESFVVLETAN